MKTENFTCVFVKRPYERRNGNKSPSTIYEWYTQKPIALMGSTIVRIQTHRFYRLSRCQTLKRLFTQVRKLYNFPEEVFDELCQAFMSVDMIGHCYTQNFKYIRGYDTNEFYTLFDLTISWEHTCATSVISSTS